jgi:hypothetical protein
VFKIVHWHAGQLENEWLKIVQSSPLDNVWTMSWGTGQQDNLVHFWSDLLDNHGIDWTTTYLHAK